MLPAAPGFAYNAVLQKEGAKVFIMLNRDVSKGEEIFFPYGRYVFDSRISEAVLGVRNVSSSSRSSKRSTK